MEPDPRPEGVTPHPDTISKQPMEVDEGATGISIADSPGRTVADPPSPSASARSPARQSGCSEIDAAIREAGHAARRTVGREGLYGSADALPGERAGAEVMQQIE